MLHPHRPVWRVLSVLAAYSFTGACGDETYGFRVAEDYAAAVLTLERPSGVDARAFGDSTIKLEVPEGTERLSLLLYKETLAELGLVEGRIPSTPPLGPIATPDWGFIAELEGSDEVLTPVADLEAMAGLVSVPVQVDACPKFERLRFEEVPGAELDLDFLVPLGPEEYLGGTADGFFVRGNLEGDLTPLQTDEKYNFVIGAWVETSTESALIVGGTSDQGHWLGRAQVTADRFSVEVTHMLPDAPRAVGRHENAILVLLNDGRVLRVAGESPEIVTQLGRPVYRGKGAILTTPEATYVVYGGSREVLELQGQHTRLVTFDGTGGLISVLETSRGLTVVASNGVLGHLEAGQFRAVENTAAYLIDAALAADSGLVLVGRDEVFLFVDEEGRYCGYQGLLVRASETLLRFGDRLVLGGSTAGLGTPAITILHGPS